MLAPFLGTQNSNLMCICQDEIANKNPRLVKEGILEFK